MLKKEDQDKIDRYLRGVATEQETRYVESLLADGDTNLSLRHYIHKEWEENPGEVSESDSHTLSTILQRIHTVLDQEKERPSTWRRALHVYTRVAAILLLPLIALAAFYVGKSSTVEPNVAIEKAFASIYAPMGSRTSFELPDGTRGTLNGGSTLTYSAPFIDDRAVKLEGEAWFDVKHDDKNPFHVAIADCSVVVLGTSFNVNAYPDSDYMEVVLAEGRVNFVTAEKEEIPLLPSERLQYSRGSATKVKTDPEQYHAWTEGKLIFRGDPMTEVTRRLERWYHVDIQIADKVLEEYSFFATFQDDTLDEVLKFLSMTSPMTYKILPPKRLKNGDIKKREVVLYSTRKSIN